MNLPVKYRVYAVFKDSYGFVFNTFSDYPYNYEEAKKIFDEAKSKGCYKVVKLIRITETIEDSYEDEE